MPLSLQMEQFVVRSRNTTVRQVARKFGVSEARCREELERLEAFGVEVRADGRIVVPECV